MLAFLALSLAIGLGAADVASIHIDSCWTGLGRPAQYHTVLKPGNGGFVRSDGTLVSKGTVEAFLNALFEPHPGKVTPAEVGITPQTLRTQKDEFEKDFLSDTYAYPDVRRAFEQDYFEFWAVQGWLDGGFRGRHTDDYPQLSIVVRARDGRTVSLSSQSQYLYMLPIMLQAQGGTQQVIDAMLAHAIAALLPDGAVNKSRLEYRSLLSNWASDIADFAPNVQAARNQIGRAGVEAAGARHGLTVTSFSLSSVGHYALSVINSGEPQINAEVHPDTHNMDALFAQVHQYIEQIQNTPFLARALARTPNGNVHILPGYGLVFSWDPTDLRDYYHHPKAAAYLVAHRSQAVRLWISATDHKTSDWYWFPGGTAILMTYDAGMADFPIDFEHLPHSADRYSDRQFVGLIVKPDGTVDASNP